MINRNLIQRLQRIERQLKPQVEDIKPADIEIIRRLNQARRRLALEGDERYAAYKDLPPQPQVYAPSHPTELVMILNAARRRMNQENELARHTAAAAAAKEESKLTEA